MYSSLVEKHYIIVSPMCSEMQGLIYRLRTSDYIQVEERALDNTRKYYVMCMSGMIYSFWFDFRNNETLDNEYLCELRKYCGTYNSRIPENLSIHFYMPNKVTPSAFETIGLFLEMFKTGSYVIDKCKDKNLEILKLDNLSSIVPNNKIQFQDNLCVIS